MKDKQPKACLNPSCGKVLDQDEGRSDKKYCCPKCKSAHHNAETKKKQAFYVAQNKELMRHERILQELYATNLYHESGVPADVLTSRGFVHSYCISQKGHQATDQNIRWFYFYGLEVKTKDSFFIHKQTLSNN